MRYGQHSYSLARAALIAKAERDYTRADDGKFSENAGGGGGAKAKDEPKGKQSPEERAEAKAAQQAENRSTVGDVLNANDDERLSKKGLENLAAFAEGGELDPATQEHMVKNGLVQVDQDGVVSLTPEGRKVVSAANKGDADAVGRALDDAGKRVAGAGARAAEAQAKADAKTQAQADKEKAKAEAEGTKKPKGGGGGGGGAKDEPKEEPKPDEEPADKEKVKAEAKAKATSAAAQQAGISPADLDGMRAAADGGAPDAKAVASLSRAGLMEQTPDGPQLTAAGRKALGALERGDARGAVAARQQGRAAQRQAAARQSQQATRQQERQAKEKERAGRAAEQRRLSDARAARERELLSPWLKAFVPFGDGALTKVADAQIVMGIASTAIVDDQPGVWEGQRYDGDVVDPAAMRDALADYWGNIRAMHQDGADAVGTALDIHTAADGRTYLVAKIVDSDAWRKVRSQVYKGFSIGGRVLRAVLERLPDGRVVRRILKLLLTEISLVDRPANPEAAILVYKRSGMDPNEETEQEGDALGALGELTGATLAKAADPTKVVQQIQALRDEAELAGDLEGAERMTQAIGLLLVGAGTADDPAEAEADIAADAEQDAGDEVAMAADAGDEEDPAALEAGAGPMRMAARAQLRKAGRKIAGSRMKVMKDAVMAYLKVLADAGDGDSAAMLKAVSAPPMDAKAMIAELQKATRAPLETIAQAILKLHGDVEALKAQPAGGGPVTRFAGQAVAKRLGAGTQAAAPLPDPQAVARLRQLIATEQRPQLLAQYQDELKRLTA